MCSENLVLDKKTRLLDQQHLVQDVDNFTLMKSNLVCDIL